MRKEDARDVTVIIASAIGIVAGHALRDRPSDTAPPGSAPADGAPSSDAGPLVDLSSLFATTTLARNIGERAGLRPDNVVGHAAVAFATAAGLTYFADSLKPFIPGLKRR